MTPEIEAWLRDLTAWDVLGALLWVGVIVAGLRYLVPLITRVRGLVDKLHDVADDWHGTPEVRDGSGAVLRDAQPGVIARLDAIEYQVKPNHGGSAHDSLMRKLDELGQKLEKHQAESTKDRADLRRRLDLLDSSGPGAD